MGGDQLYSPSLDLVPKDGSQPFEIDFVWMETSVGWDRPAVILGECKDLYENAFEKQDILNLRRAAESLPKNRFDTYLLLAKLSKFTTEEVELAKTLNDGFRPKVIMLTNRELEPYHVYEKTKKEFPAIREYVSSASDLANTTAQIYFSTAKP